MSRSRLAALTTAALLALGGIGTAVVHAASPAPAVQADSPEKAKAAPAEKPEAPESAEPAEKPEAAESADPAEVREPAGQDQD